MKNKYILGISGWNERSHDASACIISNGQILCMAEEERFTRKKHAYDTPPYRATSWCLGQLKLTLDDIDTIAVGWDYQEQYRQAGLSIPSLEQIENTLFPSKYFNKHKKLKIELVPHHLAHAASAFYLSGMTKSSILVIDGQGETASTTFAYGDETGIKIIKSFPIALSIGYFYEAISDFIGIGLDGAGKTMGLAPYGKVIEEFKEFKLEKDGYTIDLPPLSKTNSLDQQLKIVDAWQKVFQGKFGSKNIVTQSLISPEFAFKKSYKLNQKHKDIAASAQNAIERVILHLANTLVSLTGENNLCIAGGVGLNCSTNTIVAQSDNIYDLFIPPFANDGGVSAGAALYICGINTKKRFNNPYLGPGFSNSEIKKILDRLKCNYVYYDDIESVVAKKISEGSIVSRFKGKMEVGPRALGNRSILANPGDPLMLNKVNNAKSRELWRPLAPSIAEKEMDLILENAFESPYMLHTFQVRNDLRKKLPAIVHVDGSTRPQSITKLVNPDYSHLVYELKKYTGYAVTMNTSFNGPTEPIVCSPLDAISSFFLNSTDYLAIENFLIKK